ncbi:hypothetical protein FALCPG4_19022 [Fusarium falciforme]
MAELSWGIGAPRRVNFSGVATIASVSRHDARPMHEELGAGDWARSGSGWALALRRQWKWVKNDHSSRPPSTQGRGATCCDGGDSGGASAAGGLCVEKSDDDGDRKGPRRPQSAFKALGNSVCAGVQVLASCASQRPNSTPSWVVVGSTAPSCSSSSLAQGAILAMRLGRPRHDATLAALCRGVVHP